MEKGITKRNSQMLYGVAILLMLYHHLFCLPERLGCEYVSLLGEWEVKVAWFAKMCVAIYAFVSGYAACVSVNKNRDRTPLLKVFWQDVLYSGKRILLLLKKVALVSLVFLPLGIYLGHIHFDWVAVWEGVKKNSFIYNGEWWYIFQFFLLMVAFPFVDTIITKVTDWLSLSRKRIVLIGSVALVLCVLGVWFVEPVGAFYHRNIGKLYYDTEPVYLLIFVVGYLCKKYELLTFGKPGGVSGWIDIPAGVLLVISSFAIRTYLADDVMYMFADIFLIAPFVLGLCLITNRMKWLQKLLAGIGKYSTYMWLTHSFYCYYYFREFITVSKVSTVMFLQLFVVSFATAVVFAKAEDGMAWLGKKIRDGC